jgi:hypothetical protein
VKASRWHHGVQRSMQVVKENRRCKEKTSQRRNNPFSRNSDQKHNATKEEEEAYFSGRGYAARQHLWNANDHGFLFSISDHCFYALRLETRLSG